MDDNGDPLWAEAKTALMAVSSSHNLGLYNVILSHLAITSIIADINIISKSLNCCSFSIVVKHANRATHSLAEISYLQVVVIVFYFSQIQDFEDVAD